MTKQEQVLNTLYCHCLRGGEDQLAVRYPRSLNSWDGDHADPSNTGDDLRAGDSPKHRATNWSTTATDRNHTKRPRILKSEYRRHATLRSMDAKKSSSRTDTSTEAMGTMRNRDCRTNSFMRESNRGTPGYHYLFHPKKTTGEAGTRIENDFQGNQGQHLQDNLAQDQRPRRASPYVGNDIRVRVRGVGESLNRMRQMSHRTDRTQDLAPRAC